MTDTTAPAADPAETGLPKTFDPATIEARWAAHWEANGLFRPHRPDATPFTIVNPPPNVTGALHIGHALDNTLQDVLVRYERLRGKDALWVVGTDHAGIATQMVVERQMAERQDKRTNYSRKDFIAKVWEWKAESGGQITQQLRRLGCSMDWSREQFTMDPHFTKAVVKVFVQLYNEGLLYRDKRLVNWDPGLKTAISDLEVETREVQGKFWHFRYPLADGVTTADGKDHVVVATTRPETMLADMAVAVNAADPRYQSLLAAGAKVVLPITGRTIPIIADDHADPELGSGAVKITPGHDFNDFEVGKRAGFKPAEMLNMFDADAQVVQCGGIPDEFLGLPRFKTDGVPGARELVVARMKQLGLLVLHIDKDGTVHDAEPRTIQTPFGDRSGQVIEPWLTDQWYVDAKTLAQPAIEAVRTGKIEIVPKSWEKTFFNWMENIQPWCVSRQLWWGHQIPVWYGFHVNEEGDPTDRPWTKPGQVLDTFFDASDVIQRFVAETEDGAKAMAAEYYPGRQPNNIVIVSGPQEARKRFFLGTDQHDSITVPIWRDPDVLDTWFSSALWPFATLGWPEEHLPPRDGEGDHAQHGGGGIAPSRDLAATGADPSTTFGGPPPRSGEVSSLLARHYPNDVLISGFDILFFWDARMMMQGLHFMGDVPWKTLYLHGLVRAPDGAKMAKSKGNVVNPLGLIDTYGADALRFFMSAMESQGRDIKMDDARLEGYRNFATKLWNAARFCQSNGIGASATVAAPPATLPVNRWIIGEAAATATRIETALAAYRFDDAANAIYQFAWGTFCDWYLELIKPTLNPPRDGEDQVNETRAVAGWVLDQILVMLHPFMPFITEELWHALGARDHALIVAQWPEPRAEADAQASAVIDLIIEAVRKIRAARTELNISPSARMEAYVAGGTGENLLMLKTCFPSISKLARINWSDLPSGGLGQSNTVQVTVLDMTIALQLDGVIDVGAERARLEKALAAAVKDRDSLAARLANPAFAERAKPEAIAKAREDHDARAAEAQRLEAALARLA